MPRVAVAHTTKLLIYIYIYIYILLANYCEYSVLHKGSIILYSITSKKNYFLRLSELLITPTCQ